MAALKDVMEGKPVRSPLHPAALLPLSVVLDAASWMFQGGERGLVWAAFVCLVAGVGTGLLAAVFGIVDYTEIRNDHPAKKTATLHLVLNVIALGAFGASAGLRYGALDATRTPGWAFGVSLVALGLMGYGGYLGGHLVYSDGIGVGRHRRRTPLPEDTLRPRGGKPDEAVAVASDAALPEGGTLRAEVRGVVVTIARLQGKVTAFQEFCTHRYGPMSEGKLCGHEVICPWHNSRFDVRTGKVTHGPAKVDLRTFPVEIRDGKIWVRAEREK
jgi:nitrite reductase/ring-hydroxylating ferredoxin subunit/uncharacterized membrane protein